MSRNTPSCPLGSTLFASSCAQSNYCSVSLQPGGLPDNSLLTDFAPHTKIANIPKFTKTIRVGCVTNKRRQRVTIITKCTPYCFLIPSLQYYQHVGYVSSKMLVHPVTAHLGCMRGGWGGGQVRRGVLPSMGILRGGIPAPAFTSPMRPQIKAFQ